jgi:hypothetical protein
LKLIKYLVIMVFFATATFSAIAQGEILPDTTETNKLLKNPEGTEFWLCFMRNYKDPQSPSAGNMLQLEFFITGNRDANVRIRIKGIGYDEKVFVPAKTVKNVKIPPEAELKSSEIIEQLSVNITSDNPVTIYGLNRRFQTTDTYLALPVEVLGKEYRVMCYSVSVNYTPQFAIIAAEDSTEIKILPTVNTEEHIANEVFTVILNKGEVYQVAAAYEKFSACDLTGSLIKSNKKIAVFSGHQCAYVPNKIIACNHLVEQMPPIHSWGKHFYIGMFNQRSNYTYRVLANENNTKVFEDSKLVKILKGGEFYENTLSQSIQLTADRPVLVAQYSQGYRNGDSIGDPMMLLVTPTQQFLSAYRFATPVNGFWKHSVNVIVPTTAIRSLRLDSRPVDSSVFKTLGISRYSIAQINIPFGSHSLECSQPFGMYSYGFGFDKDAFDAYGTMGGGSYVPYEAAIDTVPPEAEEIVSEEKNKNSFNVILRDDDVDDSGIRSITILKSEGMIAEIPKFEEGLLQVSTWFKPENPGVQGRVVFTSTDIALNKSTWTVCYYYDRESDSYLFALNRGEIQSCEVDPGIQIGAFLRGSSTNHITDFSTTDNIKTLGRFGNTSSFSGIGGFSVGRRFFSKTSLSARIFFENYSSSLLAPDSVKQHVRDSSGNVVLFQEGRELELKAVFMNLSLAAEYYFKNYFYGLAGLNFSLNISDAIEVNRRILFPGNYFYEGRKNSIPEPGAPKNLSTINSLRIGVFVGLGFTYPVSKNLSVFTEILYTHYLSNFISDGDWSVRQLTAQAGVKLRL